jgi:hypothetical protein
MGVTIHGFIECPAWGRGPNADRGKRLFRYNSRVIAALPASDPDWPFLTRGMFSVLPLRTAQERWIPQYESQLIHFAGDYKSMIPLEAKWVTKFERLLAMLCWYRAVVIDEFTKIRYEWDVELLSEQTSGYFDVPPRPPRRWKFRCFKVELQPLPVNEALDGALASEHHSGDTGAA